MSRVESEMIRWGKLLFERKLISGWGGNLSCRLGEKRFLITGQHAALGFLKPNDLVRINGEGRPIKKNQRASSETPLHLAVYRNTDARAVVHAHPPLVVGFSLTHEIFVPGSFEEKYTLGEVPVIPQDTPTVTKPQAVVEQLKYRPVVIIKGHGTVAIGKELQEAFLLTDLLQEAIRCHFFKERSAATVTATELEAPPAGDGAAIAGAETRVLFSREHMAALVDSANNDPQFRQYGNEAGLSTSLTLHLEEDNSAWTVKFVAGEITAAERKGDGEFVISGKKEWWRAVFSNRIDPFLATQQGKLRLRRGELAKLSRWYKPFERAFLIWQTIPVQ